MVCITYYVSVKYHQCLCAGWSRYLLILQWMGEAAMAAEAAAAAASPAVEEQL